MSSREEKILELRSMFAKYSVRSKNELMLLAETENHIQEELVEYFEKKCWGRTEINTYDGYYCLSNYPINGKHTFLYKERGAIHHKNSKFSSYSACLIYGIFGETELPKHV